MLNQAVLRLQKYVLDMESKALGKGFTLNAQETRGFSYVRNNMAIEDDEKMDDEKKK